MVGFVFAKFPVSAFAQGSLLVGLLRESEGTDRVPFRGSAEILRPLSRKRDLGPENATPVEETLCSPDCMSARLYVGQVVCSLGYMLARLYVRQVVCPSGCMLARLCVRQVACWPGLMFAGLYVG